MHAGVLLHHLETHIGIVVLITNKPEAIDTAFQRRIRFSMTVPMPDAALRSAPPLILPPLTSRPLSLARPMGKLGLFLSTCQSRSLVGCFLSPCCVFFLTLPDTIRSHAACTFLYTSILYLPVCSKDSTESLADRS